MEYTIENNFLRVTVSTLGAELISVIKKETEEEMLWTADPDIWPRHAPILFPYCGRLKDGKYTHKDITYEGAPHGFARDLEHTLQDKSNDRIELILDANALTMEKYPFAFQLVSTYWLEDCVLHHGVRVHNDGEEVMPFGFGYHPGFICPFDAAHSVEDYALVFDMPETPTVVETDLTTGLVTGRTYTYFENGTEIPLTDHLFDRDSICFKGLQSKTLSILEKSTGRKVSVAIEGFPYVLIWSMAGPVRFVCIEPWFGLPDPATATGCWAEKPASVQLAPGADWKTRLSMQFAR